MTVNEDRATQSEATNQSAVARYTFQQLLERRVEKAGLDLVFHIHVPKASGGTVNVFFRQNNFLVLDFDMTTANFFANIPEHQFLEAYRAPPPRQSYLLSGHFRLDHPIFRRTCVPHLVITTLRDPIDRMLSNYNFTLRMPHNPRHDDIVTRGMSFVDYAAKMSQRSVLNTAYSTTRAEAACSHRYRHGAGMPGELGNKGRPLRAHRAI